MPVFHVGFFKHTISILQCICKTCARILLSFEDREKHFSKLRGNNEPSMNLKVLRLVIEDCKKMRTCIHCGAYNGTVKKNPNEPLKIIHEKFKVSKEHDLENLI